MSSPESVAMVSARAAISSYIVLAGFWYLLALVYAVLAVAGRGRGMEIGVIVPFVVGTIWVAWLRGFRLRIGAGKLEYRDGLYKSVEIPLCEIKAVKSTSVKWRFLGRLMRVPRLVIVYGLEVNCLAINTKPFRKHDIQLAINLLRGSRAANRGEGPV